MMYPYLRVKKIESIEKKIPKAFIEFIGIFSTSISQKIEVSIWPATIRTVTFTAPIFEIPKGIPVMIINPHTEGITYHHLNPTVLAFSLNSSLTLSGDLAAKK
tara:strand:- start:7 stop:315 length:309 start_codon:yes stop_codon:yes gene_type:complete